MDRINIITKYNLYGIIIIKKRKDNSINAALVIWSGRFFVGERDRVRTSLLNL